MEQIMINSSYLFRLFGRPLLYICFLSAFYLFNHSTCSHPSLEVVHLFMSEKVWQSLILWSALCRFHSLHHCHSLPLIAICCHSLSLDVPLVCLFITIPAGIYLLKVNNRNTRTRCEICSKLTIKTPERR